MTIVGEGNAVPEAGPAGARGRVIYRQSVFTRLTHWVWALSLFFLLLSGLQIFNAHPVLYIGEESGFEYDNAVLRMRAENTPDGPRGFTTVFGQKFDTTGLFAMSDGGARPAYRAFPAWATIPSFQDLATGRVVHFFFAWILAGTLAVWAVASLVNGHLWRDVVVKPSDLRALPRDIADHLRFRFKHGRSYSPLQKTAYFVVLAVLFPLIILTGLTMSPGMNAAWPWLLDLFGGRQTARTIHFAVMVLLVLFFLVHIIMVVLAGPLNELRSMITGYYRTGSGTRGRRPMSDVIFSRRRLIGLGAASASSLVLGGCSQFDFLGRRDDPVRDFLERANELTYAAQRALVPDQALAREYAESEIRQGQRPNGSTDPRDTSPEYLALEQGGFSGYRLRITGLVEQEKSFTLAELRNMPSRTQITRHDCVEGWSCIAKWTGTPLSAVLDEARPRPTARFLVYHCYDVMGGGLSAPEPYYESCDLIDAYHPQTILAYGLNGEALPVANGAPIRVRIERAARLQAAQIRSHDRGGRQFRRIGRGKGGYWEDHGYDWYGGI
jgi:thiosulfate reductase cytochrome b subunit/DMSO/TMAO reductase YedYZ molybdopterin-dependent catalytic subunit